MAGLKKPDVCSVCLLDNLTRRYNPERWECSNGHVVASRKQKPITGLCRGCGKKKGEVEFSNYSNICKACKSAYHKIYRAKNIAAIQKQHRDSYQRDKKKRQEAVKIAVEKSPESFIRYLWHHLRKDRREQVRLGHLNPVCLNVTVTYEDLVKLWNSQSGICPISRVPMVHKRGDMKAISIDRIDSSKGYTLENIQLVCQCINLMKNKRSNEEVLAFLNMMEQAREKGRLGDAK